MKKFTFTNLWEAVTAIRRGLCEMECEDEGQAEKSRLCCRRIFNDRRHPDGSFGRMVGRRTWSWCGSPLRTGNAGRVRYRSLLDLLVAARRAGNGINLERGRF
jgi:hypothetical protein